MDDDCKPGLADAQYPRGPSDTNSAMFPFERKMAEAIKDRYGSPEKTTTTEKGGNKSKMLPGS